MRGKLCKILKKTPYGKVLEELTVFDGVLLKGSRLVILTMLTQRVIEAAHEGHGLGETKTIHYLKEGVLFPKLTQKSKYM